MLKLCHGVFYARTGLFWTWVEAEDEKKALAAGKRVLRDYPDAKGSFNVVRGYLEHGWKLPKLETSYTVLRRWALDRVDGAKEPDLRLAFLNLVQRTHPRGDMVKNGGIVYCRA